MNTANLQIEGLLLLLTSLVGTLEKKGVLSRSDIDAVLSEAESAAKQNHGGRDSLSDSNHDAILFPIRFLKATTHLRDRSRISFGEIAAAVGGIGDRQGA